MQASWRGAFSRFLLLPGVIWLVSNVEGGGWSVDSVGRNSHDDSSGVQRHRTPAKARLLETRILRYGPTGFLS